MVEVPGDYIKLGTSSFDRYFGSIGNKSMREFQKLAIANPGLVLSLQIHFVVLTPAIQYKTVYNTKKKSNKGNYLP